MNLNRMKLIADLLNDAIEASHDNRREQETQIAYMRETCQHAHICIKQMIDNVESSMPSKQLI